MHSLPMDKAQTMDAFAAKRDQLKLAPQTGKIRLKKRTISNLFRYAPRERRAPGLSLSDFNNVIAIDVENKTLNVEGLATYERVVDFTLARGLLPLVVPELKHITVGGATVGIGIESTGFRRGFVHDGLIEAEVLLPDGGIVLCNGSDSHTDLFHALPNSYGTLGYILRAKIRLLSAKRYVHIKTSAYSRLDDYLQAMQLATEDADNDFVEGLFFATGQYYLMVSRFTDDVPQIHDILRKDVFYKLVQRTPDVYLTTKDYIFRYDPEWFWNIPESKPYQIFRKYAPRRLRNSAFYTRYCEWERAWERFLPWQRKNDREPLIQDWEVPWENAGELVKYAVENVDLGGKPWVAVPIKTPVSPTLYPIRANQLYFNLGCYCQVKKVAGKGDYHYTKIMDRKCFELGGIKMLYSSSFLSREEFERLYNGAAYARLKARYDPQSKAYTLFEKTVTNASRE
jgi:FAD/FMN-containing dehydrogenase